MNWFYIPMSSTKLRFKLNLSPIADKSESILLIKILEIVYQQSG